MTLHRRIIETLHSGPRHILAISEAVGYLHGIVADELHDMEDRGEVIQHETGLYQLSAATQQAGQERKRR